MLTVMNDGFVAKKSLGQHFLNSPTVPRWLADAAEIAPGESVLEIGPGTGALTAELLSRGANVLALEADERAIAVLTERFKKELGEGRLRLDHHDVRELDLAKIGLSDHSFKVVSNIPYYLTGQLFRVLLSGPIQPRVLVFLVQKEVGKRATAKRERGDKESLLSLSIKVFGDTSYEKTVGKGHFTPPPKVDSAIISVKNIGRDRFKTLDQDLFFKLLHLSFASKRKQLIGNLSQEYERTRLMRVFERLPLRPDVRAEDLTLEEWLRLATEIDGLRP